MGAARRGDRQLLDSVIAVNTSAAACIQMRRSSRRRNTGSVRRNTRRSVADGGEGGVVR